MELDYETLYIIVNHVRANIEEVYPPGTISPLKLLKKGMPFAQLDEVDKIKVETSYRHTLNSIKEHCNVLLEHDTWWDNLI